MAWSYWDCPWPWQPPIHQGKPAKPPQKASQDGFGASCTKQNFVQLMVSWHLDCFKILRNQSNSRYIWLNQIQKSHNKLIQHHGWMWIFNSSKRLRLEWTKCPDDTLSLSSETKPPKSNYWYFTPREWLKASHHTAIYCIFYISRKTITVTITTSMNWE